MVKIRPFDGYTLAPQFFSTFLVNNMENLINSRSEPESNQGTTQIAITTPEGLQKHKQSLFIYQQIFQGKETYGLISQISLEDYHKGTIKKHEKTLNRRDRNHQTYKERLINPVTIGFDFEEIQNSEQQELKFQYLLQEICQKGNLLTFADWHTADGREHTLYVLDSRNEKHSVITRKLVDSLKEIQRMYILDGHHRFQAAYYNFLEHQSSQEDNKSAGDHPLCWIPAFIYPRKYISVHAQHRVLRSPFLENNCSKLIAFFDRSKVDLEEITGPYDFEKLQFCRKVADKKDAKGHDLLMITKQKTIGIRMRQDLQPSSQQFIISKYLDEEVLMPIFEHCKETLERHLKFIPGIQKSSKIIQQIRSQTKAEEVLFLVKPIDLNSLLAIADKNEVLPPKSTWLEPKPCTEMVLRAC